MVNDILIRCYRKDFDWLPWCLRSIHQRLSDYNSITLVVPIADVKYVGGFVTPDVNVVACKNYYNDYLGQMLTKFEAFQYVSGDYVTFIDCDTVFRSRISIKDLMDVDGRPIVHRKSYDLLKRANSPSYRWYASSCMFHDQDISHEYLQQAPLTYQTEDLRAFYSAYHHRLLNFVAFFETFPSYKTDCFADHNILMPYMYEHKYDNYHFIDTVSQDDIYPVFHKIAQFRTWEGLTEQTISLMKEYEI